MGFFKDFKEDLSQAVDELASDTIANTAPDDDTEVNTLTEDLSEKAEEAEKVEEVEKVEKVEKESLKKETNTMKKEKDEIDLEELMANMEAEAMAAAEAEAKDSDEGTGEDDSQPEEMEEDDDDGSVAEETAIITKGLTVIGDLNSRGSIDLFGAVEGNVACRGKLTVSGSITGNTKSMEIFANNARIDGNIETTGSVKIGQGTVIIGNISATSAVIAGAVKGDIDVHGPVIVDESAVIIGDIKSRTVQINNGATIDGRCSQCYAQQDINAIFNKKTTSKKTKK